MTFESVFSYHLPRVGSNPEIPDEETMRMKTITKKQLVVGLITATAVFTAPALALTPAQSEVLTKSVASAKVVEVPAAVAKAIEQAAKEDRSEVAVTTVVAAIKAHPSTVGTAVTAAVKAAPDATEAIVTAALEAAPNSALTIVSAAAQGAPDQSEKIAAIAAHKMPTRAASFDREVAVIRGRRAAGDAALLVGGSVTQTPRPPGPPPTQVYSTPGFDPGRP